MESPRKTLTVPKGNKYENDQEAGRSPNMKTPKRGHGLFFKGECESDQEMGARNVTVENPKRSSPAATKHFMVPTISAVSKASPARKKVLGERNEAAETHLVKTPLPRSRSFSRDRFGVNENTDSVVDGMSVKGRASMDSSTPRPKFLRYNPERRKEVVLRRENKVKECKKDGAFGPLESGYVSDDMRYDPVRNYLSPRPKFLWYDPNRSRERTLRRETEAKDPSDCDNVTDLGYSSGSLSSQDLGIEREEVEESDESGGEDKEVSESDREVTELDQSNKEVDESDGEGKEVDESGGEDKEVSESDRDRDPSDSDNVTDLGYSSGSLSSQDLGIEREEVEESDESGGEDKEVSESDREVTELDQSNKEVDESDGEGKEVDESGGEDKEVSESDREVTELDQSNKEFDESDGEGKEVDESGGEDKEVSESDREVTELDQSNKEVDESEKKSNKAEEGNMDRTNCLEAHNDNAGEVDFVDSGSVVCEESDGGGEVNEDVDESDLEIEEAEVEKGWCLRGALKFVLLLFALAVSSSLILNTNSSYPPTSLELERNVEREGGQITFAENDQMALIWPLNLEVPGMSFTKAVDGQDMDDGEMHSEGIDDAVEDENFSRDLIGGESDEVRLYVELEESGKELGSLLELCNVESLDLEGLVVPETCHISATVLNESEGVESPQHLAQKNTVGADEGIQLVASDLESATDISEGASEVAIEETPELLAVELQEIELPSPTYGPESANVLMEPIKEQIVDSEVVERIENPSDVNANPEILSGVAEVEVLEVPFTMDVIPGHEMKLEGVADDMESANADLDEHIEDDMVDAELGIIRSTIICGISALSLAAGSLFWALRVKSKRTTKKETIQVEEPSVENKQNLEHVVPTLAATKTPFDLMEKYSRAPSVELLSEFAVGEMSSLRTCGMKSRIVEADEVSSHSVPFGKAMTRKAYSVPVQVQPAISAISSTENRSVTNWEESSEVESSKKKKLTTPASRRTSRVRSEDEGSEVLSMNTTETPTTLRRSSRLRSRGIISP